MHRVYPAVQSLYTLGCVVVCAILIGLSGCSPNSTRQGSSTEWSKVEFDLSLLDADGLLGENLEKRAVAYEFCIPAESRYVRAVEGVDPTVVVSPSPGRIGCSRDHYLCLGSTHQENFRDVLQALTQFEFIERIVEAEFE